MKKTIEGLSVWLEPEEITFMIELLDVAIKHWSEDARLETNNLTKCGLREAGRRALEIQRKFQVRLTAYNEAYKKDD